jgi:adenylosuccinate synthase
LSKPLASKRFFKVEEIVPGWFAHRMRITDPAELDAQVQRWVKRAYETTGTHGVKKVAR